MSTRLLSGVTRWSRAAICLGMIGSLVAACSVLLDHDGNQCDTDADCAKLGGFPKCVDHACAASGVGPEGCFSGDPKVQNDFRNQCGTAQCVPFDNCKVAGICKPTDDAAAADPGTPDAASGATVDADQSSQPSCIADRDHTVVVGGSTAVQGFMPGLATLLSQTGYKLAYQPSGSCTGVDQIFNVNRATVKDITGKQALLFDGANPGVPCTFGPTGTTLDVAVSDVFSTSCDKTYVNNFNGSAEYLGPIQPMTFAVPATADLTAMSAEYGKYIFGRPSSDFAMPYDDPSLHFVRNSGSGTQQMISRAIGVDAAKWWGVDSGSSGKVRDTLEAVAPAKVNQAIGILSTDVTDPVRAQLRVLAFKDANQICSYYPDSSLFTKDKINVRDGHYAIWGPIHFFAKVNNGVPIGQAAPLLTNFTLPRLPRMLLDSITDVGFVPPCAMKVSRDAEMGDMKAYSPTYQCGCYFDSRVAGKPAPGCVTCTSASDCSGTTPACNEGYCEEH